MNEQIKQLAIKAGGEFWQRLENDAINPEAYITFDPPESLEKFAELIVRECCLALWTEECHTSDLAFDEVKRNATRIKEHFGVEE